MKKVVFAASVGGHLNEILRLEKLFNEYDYLLVTEKTDVTRDLDEKYNVKFLKYGPNKNIIKYVYIAIYNMVTSLYIALKYRPDTVISTGAQIGGMVCMACKILGAKVIYIESLAKTNELSVTGRNVYRFADKFYVQWEQLAKKYEKAEYLGRLV